MGPPALEQILQYTNVVANALREASIVTQTPFLNSISTLSLTIISMVQNVKLQRDRYLRIVEGIHQVLCALTSLCVDSEHIRSPKTLEEIAHYAGTLQKLHSCLRAQQELGTLKRLFKQSEITLQLDQCEKELNVASQAFILNFGVATADAAIKLEDEIERRHQEVLELISAKSFLSEDVSSLHRDSINLSSESFSLLPASPKLFCGRDSELIHVVKILTTDGDPARIAVLGPGGMGKTTLAMAVLHHPTIIEKYSIRYFISCESTPTCADLMLAVGSHLGLEPSRQPSNAILQHFKQFSGPCLLVLDNFETAWEAPDTRAEVEDFLAVLADIPNLALLVTMRGAERPGKVKWSRPFLLPLEPLSPSAARQMFLEIAEDPELEEEAALDELLDLSGSLPLALSLMASIASLEGYHGTLSRWQIENISLLSDGHDKRSNLEKSITLSLSSPRVSSSPQARDLLALLSLLPDGIRTEDLMSSHVPIPHIRQTQTLLLRTSLAYLTTHGRLKALSPIREYIRRVHPPSPTLSLPLRVFFQDLLSLWHHTGRYLPAGNLAPDLLGYLGNINELLLDGLIVTEDASQLKAIGNSIVTLDEFSSVMKKGNTPLFRRLPHLIERTGDSELRWKYGRRCLRNPDSLHALNEEPDAWIEAGAKYFSEGTHPVDQAVTFYDTAAWHYTNPKFINIPKSTKFNALAMSLAEDAANIDLQLMCLKTEYDLARRCGDTPKQILVVQKAQRLAQFSSSNPSLSKCDWLDLDAWVSLYIGNLPRALALCEEIDDLLVSCGMEGSDRYLTLLDIRAEVHYRKSEYVEARGLHVQAVQLTSPTTNRRYHANALISMAYLDILTERPVEEILANVQAAEAVYALLGVVRVVICSFVRAMLQLRCGETEDARTQLLQCLTRTRGIYHDLHGYCLAALGDAKHGFYDPTETFRWVVVSLAFFRKMKEPVESLNALRRLAAAHAVFSEEETALGLFQVALEGASKIGIHRLKAECMLGIGDIREKRGEREQAAEMWKGAHPLFVRCLRRTDAGAVEERLRRISSL
ncbi:NB-ARC domain-containing protein [Favolaschia claudopus]|uniref:NB-ARC domain-containing protein n=1 Tax=Favolaschia claudopus TaxID=2862362 RepID=A0AAW0DQH8_9AGAR